MDVNMNLDLRMNNAPRLKDKVMRDHGFRLLNNLAVSDLQCTEVWTAAVENGQQQIETSAVVVVLKCTDLSRERFPENCRSESKLLRQSRHPNVISALQEPFECIDKSGATSVTWFCQVLEYLADGALCEWILAHGRLSEDLARPVFCQLVEAVLYLHEEKGVAHLDLKPENILIKAAENGTRHPVHVKLCDLGSSQPLHCLQTRSIGTEQYMAPEALACCSIVSCDRGSYMGEYADLWSLGMILFIMLTGHPAIARASATDKRYRVFCKYGLHRLLEQYGRQVTDWPKLSAEVQDVLERLLRIEPPSRRLSLRQILVHDWLRRPASTTVEQPSEDNTTTNMVHQSSMSDALLPSQQTVSPEPNSSSSNSTSSDGSACSNLACCVLM